MKVDDNLGALCRMIADLKLGDQLWIELYDGETISRPPYECFICENPDDPASILFIITRLLRDYRHIAELSLETVLAIANGEATDVEFVPLNGSHPEDAGYLRVELDPDMTCHAIADAINEYIAGVLIPRGIVDERALDADARLDALKHEVAREVAVRWRVSWNLPDVPDDT